MADARFTVTNLTRVRRLIRQHYRLARPVTEREVRLEIRDLLRLKAAGLLDDRTEYLWAAISPFVHVPSRSRRKDLEAL